MNNNQNSKDTVTIDDAIEQVKKWAEEKDYEKVKQGCEEILTVQPDNSEIKALLQIAEDALKPKQETTSFSPDEKEMKSEPKMPDAKITPPVPPAMPTAKVVSPAKPVPPEPKAMPAASVVPEKLKQEAPKEAQKEEPSPMDIFAKPEETMSPLKTEAEQKPALKEKKDELGKPAVTPQTKTEKGKGTLVVLIGSILIVIALGFSIYMGFLNPLFDAILNLLGM